MGTRHSILVQVDGDYKIAQYGQWDGYPDGQGVEILKFLREEMDREKFAAAVRNCTEISEATLRRKWADIGVKVTKDGSIMATMEQSDKFKELNLHLSRDCGSDVLKLVQDAGGLELRLNKTFPAESLFCEWAYVIDLDRNTFEVYKGFNHEPLDPQERFATLRIPDDYKNDYYQVRHAHTWPLDALPDQETFLATFKEPDEEEGEEEAA